MPEKCLSCGECAVIEDDIEGDAVQRICTECGTVASGIKRDKSSRDGKLECLPFFGEEHEELVCESCGDSLSLISQTDVSICSECQALSSSGENDTQQQVLTQSGNQNEEISFPELAKCKSCGSTNIELDIIGVAEQLVCKDCGTLAKHETLTNDDFETLSRPRQNGRLMLPINAARPRKQRGKVAGLEKISFLHNKFCFPQFIKEEAIAMFNKVFEKPSIFYTHITTKEQTAAACLFVVCRQHDIPISLLHFQKYLDKYSSFLRVKKIILNSLKIHLPHMSLSRQVEHMLGKRGFHATTIIKVNDILFLCRQAWLTQGRSREGLIIIAAYYAYVSSDQCTKFISMAEFRQMFKFPNISRLLQGECSNFFLKLARSIPWVSKKNVKSNTIHKYIDDIIKYQNSLLQLAFASNDTDTSVSDKEMCEDKKEAYSPSNKNNIQKRSLEINNSNGCDYTHKEALLPSVLKKPRRETPTVPEIKFKPDVDLDSPYVKESEFDENEIASYLLSPEEEKQLRTPKLKAMFS